ncbi:hypothetical protein NP233_g10054 [Leucocoprinus birnbaumii]|uniref:Protein kinase domain-containing protein n=1 Tax=Leucocoprinus birnbaumii TaxID=56174 RepID=A0AAD5VMP7_9AGAR|nr:hypothetical protein NP233_g10054 [Leucocoprinus birnbaumii]
MASEPGQGAHYAVAPNAPNESDVFATLCHLVSQIDSEDRMQEVVKKAQELKRGDIQLLVDCLSMSLDRNAAPMKCRGYIWRSLIQISLTAKILVQNHTLEPTRIAREAGLSPSSTHSILEETSTRVKVFTKLENDQPNHTKEIISWVHLSHPNVVPIYSTFLDDKQNLLLVSPNITNSNVCDYMRKHLEVPRMALVSDIANGLSYLHDHGIVHGGLYPDCVLVSDEGRAMIVNMSISSDLEDSDSLPVRYLALEFLGEEDVQPTESSDVWSFASLSYEILSGKWPFFQIAKEVRVSGAISKGSTPVWPGVDGVNGVEINDAIWQTLLMYWKLEPPERPPCLKVYQIIAGMGTQDKRPTAKPIIVSDILKSSVVDLKRAKSSLMGVLGSEAASSLRVPEHLCDSLLRLIPDTNKLDAAAAVVLKLSPDETQCLADFLDLLLEDLTDWFSPKRKAVRNLLSLIMMSTTIIPKRYILNGVHYDTQKPLAEGAFGKAYEGRGLSHSSSSDNGESDKVLVSDQGHSALAVYSTLYILTDDPARTSTYRLRFASPDDIKAESDDMWSFGCICYEVLSGKPPYYQYTEDAEIQSAISRGELPRRPTDSDEGMEMIDDDMWRVIEQCCLSDWQSRLTALRIVEMITHTLEAEDDCPPVELLRAPLLKLLESKIKDVAAAAVELLPNDIQTLVDFLDLTLKDYVLKSEEQNRTLALLSKLTSLMQTFPQCYKVKGIQYQSVPIAEVMSRLDTSALTEWIKELVLWSHSSHPNVLPFYGVFLESTGQSQRICLVSPFMKIMYLIFPIFGLPAKHDFRPKILDVINGLDYLHVYGIIHSDLKGQNVLISDEGRGLLTDFGASHIVMATAGPTTSSVFSTLHFAAPELMEGAALSRRELPKRPSPIKIDDGDETNWDLEVDNDWDPIDDQAWTLITKCCVPDPERRLKIPAVQELIADMKVWDNRPAMRAVPGADIFKLCFKPDINLDRVGEILDKLQVQPLTPLHTKADSFLKRRRWPLLYQKNAASFNFSINCDD